MGRTPIRNLTKGFHKSRGTKPYFTHLDLRDGLIVEDAAEELGLGQGTLLRMWIEEITRNEDFLRLFKDRAKERPETEEYMKKSAEFKMSARKSLQRIPYQTFSGKRVRCAYCDREMSEFAVPMHQLNACPKAPKLKALPHRIAAVVGGDMEVDL